MGALKNESYQHRSKEHLKFNKIAKFTIGCKMQQNTENIALQSLYLYDVWRKNLTSNETGAKVTAFPAHNTN